MIASQRFGSKSNALRLAEPALLLGGADDVEEDGAGESCGEVVKAIRRQEEFSVCNKVAQDELELERNADDGSETEAMSSSSFLSGDDEAAKAPDQARHGLFSHSQRVARIGYFAQYFVVGMVHGGFGAVTYGVFLGYLNVPGYVYATVSSVAGLPWSFKVFFGLINDTMPVMGLRRKPYMVLGWSFCALMLLVLASTPLPPPYWCIDDSTGDYIQKRLLPDGRAEPAEPCHPESAQQGGKYAVLLMLAATGYIVADVAADGLTTEYARAEPIERRGATQTSAYLVRSLGASTSTLLVGTCMNGKLYNGTFSWGLSFETVCLCFCVPVALMVPISALLVRETSYGTKTSMTSGEYIARAWALFQSKSCFFVILYCFLGGLSGVRTTAQPQVKQHWAGVQNFQNQMFSLCGHMLFASGLWLVKKRFLHTSWRLMLVATTVFLQAVDSVFSTLTIFDIVRNQYFYLGEAVLTEVPAAANYVVITFVIVELADDGNEGMVYGLLTTACNLGNPFATAVANQVYRLFRPALSDTSNYIRDAPDFRWTVFYSFLLSYFFAVASQGLVLLLPDQKAQAQQRKREWAKQTVYGVCTLCLLSVGLVYSLLVTFLSMLPATMCLEFAGGAGCDTAPQSAANGTLAVDGNLTMV